MNVLLPTGSTSENAPAPRWLIAVALVGFAALYLFLYRHDVWYQWLEDLHVYAGAAQLLRNGVNPYTTDIFEGLRFVYPPVVLYALRALFTVLPFHAAWGLLAFVHLTVVLLAPLVLARYYFRERWFTPVMAVLVWLGESRFTGMQALYSANVAPTLYLGAMIAAVPGLRKNRWGWFYLAVLVAGMVKIPMLVLLLLPLFAGRKQWWPSVGCGVAVVATYLAQARFLPVLYAGYKFAVLQQVSVEHQFGYGVYGVVASLDLKLHRVPGIDAYAVHALFAGVVLGALVWLKRMRADVGEPTIWLGLLWIAVMVVNPRMLHYDAYLGLIAAYAVLAVVLRLEGWKLVALVVVLYVPSLLVPHVLHAKLLYGSYELLIMLAALVAGVWRLGIANVADAVGVQSASVGFSR